MMNQRKSALTDLVQTEGRKVMYEVTIRLYLGGTRRPDRYWHDLYGNNNNNQTFTKYFYSIQQTQLKSDYQPNDYDIKNAAKTFDVSLHWKVLKKFCGLKKSDELYKKLKKVAKMRNNVTHPNTDDDMSVSDATDKINELWKLCIDILNILQERIPYGNLTSVKNDVKNSFITILKELENKDEQTNRGMTPSSTNDRLYPMMAPSSTNDRLYPMVAPSSTNDRLYRGMAPSSTNDRLYPMVAPSSTNDRLYPMVAPSSTNDRLYRGMAPSSTNDRLYPGMAPSSTNDRLYRGMAPSSTNDRLYRGMAMSATRPASIRTSVGTQEEEEEEGLSSLSKVAIGVGVAGAGILALGALANHLSNGSQDKKEEPNRNRTSSNKEECSVM
ncbi:uncharacterized protein [Procambarus clarkii]|uniref:uncharacterized protein isoform X1 n=1 Tax=Procambarus clarkii TaxID=6728 RepID=UPI003743D9E7